MIGLRLKESTIDAIYSSSLIRALETSKAIARFHQLPVQVEYNLRELEVGELEGITLDQLGTDFTDFLIQWRQNGGITKLPGGESLIDLQNRVWQIIQNIIEKYQGSVVIVSHYFVILTIICTALNIPLTCLRRLRIQAASISILDFSDSHPCLYRFGDTCHLKES